MNWKRISRWMRLDLVRFLGTGPQVQVVLAEDEEAVVCQLLNYLHVHDSH